MVAVIGNGDRVVARRVGGDRGGGVARPILWVGDLHHIVELRVILEN